LDKILNICGTMKNPHFSIVVDKEMNLDITKLNIYLNKIIAILHAAATQSDLLFRANT
jgi:hypothetical protein